MLKKVILTGDRPTGPLHLGHFVGSLVNRVRLQETHEQFVMLADIQAATDNMERMDKVHDAIPEVLLDYLAVGLDPTKTVFLLQSAVPALAELTVHFLNLVSFGMVARNPTVKKEIEQRNMGENCTAGFMIYPVSQVADILAFKADIVPVGADQLPMIELTNVIANRFNRIFKCNVLRKCEGLVPDVGRLPGVDGKAKMGKSLNNAIYLSDSADKVAASVKMMFTDPGHLRVEDPGKIDGNVVFTYLDAFDPDRPGVEDLKARYRAGGLADSVVKHRLVEVLEATLAPIRARRKEFALDRGALFKMLKEGTDRAHSVAAQTLSEVRQAMGINYF